MGKYIIYFCQQWVGDHSAEWFASRGPLARQVVADMKAAQVLVFAGGLEEEIEKAFGSDGDGNPTGAITKDSDFLGGLTIIEVQSDVEAQEWGSRIGQACGWPQEVRRFKDN